MKLFRLTPAAKRLLSVFAIAAAYNSASGESSSSSYSVSSVASYTVSMLDRTSKVISTVFLSNEPAPAATVNTKYTRKEWQHWIDADKDCQNTRNEVLIVTAIDPSSLVYQDRKRRCTLVQGKWLDPYSNKVFTNPTDLDIDHIVPLSWAHSHGAAGWSPSQKRDFANDFQNLIAVHLKLNREKGDKGPTEWLPPNNSYRCDYISKFDAVVGKYYLKYTSSEKRTITKLQDACNKR